MAINLEALLDSTRGGGDFLTKDEKNALVDSAVPFVVVGATPIREGGTFGAETIFRIKIKGEDNERLLSLSHNSSRESLAKAINELLDNGEAFVGPFYAIKVRTGKGNPYYEFTATPPTQDAAPPLPKSSDAKAKTPSGKDDPDGGDLPW